MGARLVDARWFGKSSRPGPQTYRYPPIPPFAVSFGDGKWYPLIENADVAVVRIQTYAHLFENREGASNG